MPTQSPHSVAIALVVTVASAAATQQQIPIRAFGPVEARSTQSFGLLYGVRELPGGNVLVNDPSTRRLLLLDSTLQRITVIADSTPGAPAPYGVRPTGIVPYLADSTVLVDLSALALVVIDPYGRIARTMAVPRAADIYYLAYAGYGTPGVDPQDRLVYRGVPPRAPSAAGAQAFPQRGDTTPYVYVSPDSAPIVRASLKTRAIDTIGFVHVPRSTYMSRWDAKGTMNVRMMTNAIAYIDDWTLLPDGTVAILRGQDYHMEWVSPDGTHTSSQKMPFDWRRLTDDDKAAIIDSLKKESDRLIAAGGSSPPFLALPAVVTTRELADYMPPIRASQSFVRADRDGNVWILPLTSTHAGPGLLFDVVNREGAVFQRVRVPAGRAVEGFGRGGVIYMSTRDSTGTHLERARIK
jgi:hypothetical protein